MPCLKCEGRCDDDALVCDKCADECFEEPRFFLNPVLVGPSLFSRLRSEGSAACLLGPVARSDMVLISSADILKRIADLNVQNLQHDELKDAHVKCDAMLAHLGVPLRVDGPLVLLTEDSVKAITSVVQKINAAEKVYPSEGMSDLYIRIGVVYWSAAHSVLIRTASKRWGDTKRAYLVSKAKEFFYKVQPGDDLYSIAARNLGLLCLDVEEWTEAEEHLSEALRSFPDDIKVGESLAKAHLMLGNRMEALSRVDDIISQGERPGLWVLKGRILRDLDRPREALECFSRAISLDSHYIPGHDILINTLRNLGKIEEAALAESQRSLARRPDLERKLSELMSEFRKVAEEESPDAPIPPIAHMMEVPKRKPESLAPEPKADKLRAALDAGDYDGAIQVAEHRLEADPGDREAALAEIEALVGKMDFKAAEAKTHAFYERHREDADAWYWRGVIAHKLGKWGAAIQYLSKTVSLSKEHVGAWTLMAEVLLENKKVDGADEGFSKAIELEPENPRAWFGKALTMKQLNRWGAAIQSLDKYTALVPGDHEAWKIKGDILLEKEKFKRAIEAYDEFMAKAGDDSYTLGRKGIALNALGMVDEAKKCLEESVRLDPNNKEAAHWLRAVSGGEA
ncbi:MAG: tetratricopeptide repeat protein [Candidatus Thermoplasmatota archaeon]|nr:tetratricopeptide repeat protein [Candidatus Thermoplasmatota archaeon]